MLDNHCEALKFSDLETGRVDPLLEYVWREWRRAKGDYFSLLKVQNMLTLSQPIIVPGVSCPPLIFAGDQSPLAKCFGSDWVDNLGDTLATPDSDLEEFAAPGYRFPINGEPRLDQNVVVVKSVNGTRKRVEYRRLLIRGRFPGGKSLIVGATGVIESNILH